MNSKRLLLCAAIASVSACGGGGGSEPSATPAPPVVTPPPANNTGGDEEDTAELPPVKQSCGSAEIDDLPTASFVLSPVTQTNDLFSLRYGTTPPDNWPLEDYENVDEYTDIYELVNDSEMAESGNLVERYTIKSGQCLQSGGITDCDRGYYRSETTYQNREQRGFDRWFAMSFKIDEETFEPALGTRPFLSDQGPWITQWVNNTFDESRYLGNFFLRVDEFLSLKVDYKDYSGDSVGGAGHKDALLAQKDDFMNKWNHLVINMRFDSREDGGRAVFYLNGECKIVINSATILDTYDEATWKWGLYRSFQPGDEDFFNGVRDEPVSQTILFDNIRDGDSYEDIAY
jgi:hypothetical protein